MALTESKLQALHGKKNKTTRLLPDRDGLYISCGLKGKLSWVFRYRYDGEQTRITFGGYPEFNLQEAREKAIGYRRSISEGDNPKLEKVKRERVSIEECAKEWERVRFPHIREATRTQYSSVKKMYFTNARFGYDVQTATREDWLKYFDDVAEKSSAVNAGSVLKVLKTMLRWCKGRSIITDSTIFELNTDNVGTRAAKGQRNLQLHEVGLLWVLVNKSRATPALKNCVKLLMIFGARQSEIREANRSEFDLERGVWTLPPERSKNANEIRRPIPDKARAIIEELDDTYGRGGYLIPGAHRDTFITHSAFTRYIRRMRAKMIEIEPASRSFTAHDFRRTLSTRLSERDVLPHVTEKMLGHELGGIMAIYNKHDWIDDQRVAYEMWCQMISEAAQGELSRFG